MLKRMLIANRGEIAIRIAKAADALGIDTVAVFTQADSQSLHTRCATRAVEFGPANGVSPQDPLAPYLDREGLVRIALETGCDSVHPGYGFLSEHAAFADLCAANGLTFVGPPPSVLSLFGDKVRARAFAHSVGVPIVPGSESPLASPDHAAIIANGLGFPVMLKAAAGGGGRGMRLVERTEDIRSAFERCRGEALSAFGDGTLFMEKVIARPRHVEVQILGDAAGNIVHLYDRDCSVQERNQKVVEIAPAPNLDPALRNSIFDHAVKIAKAASYVNAGTVEFLVSPATGEHYFIECNPRIQVEHTVTEMVTGIDLVESQIRIAGGETLAQLGLASQEAVPGARGFAVQARVVARGAGVMTAYKEPTGPRVRVDSCGYQGYAPRPQFDPLFAKVIGASNSSGSFASAVDRTLRALAEFHVAGLPNNLAQLRAILAHPEFVAGDARTTFLAEYPEILTVQPARSEGPLSLLERQTSLMSARAIPASSPVPALPVATGQVGVEAPLGGALLELRIKEGDEVSFGDILAVISAMKMETNVTAPCAGTVTSVADVRPGDQLAAGQIVVVIAPEEGAAATALPEDETWAPVLGQIATLQSLAHARLAPGSSEPGVVRQRSRGKLNCRERIDLLLDDGSFHEVGSVAGFASYDDEGAISAFTPANHVGGWGQVRRRTVIVCADDFTSRGGHSDGAIGAKSSYLDRLSIELRVPAIRLLDGSSGGGSVASMVPAQRQEGESAAKESSGAITAGRPRVTGGGGSFLPGHLGSTMYAEQLATVPVVNMLLGSVVGIGAAKAVLGHFSVMVRDISQLFVAGPPVVSHAMGYDVTKEDLGDWRIHCTNGSVDNLAESEQEAVEMTRRFLSYLPSSVYEAPPVVAPRSTDPANRRDEELFTLVPRKRTTTFDIRRAIRLLADEDSFFEVGPLWGSDQVTGFVRMNGHPMGVIASDSRHVNGGALTADGCSKLTRHIDLCDLFHVPVLNLVDNPGFAVGIEHETAGTIRKGGEWMIAFAQMHVPMFTVLMRRSFGVAGNNYATPQARPSVRVAWPAADTGGIPPEGGIEAAYKRQLAEAADPEALRAELYARIESARGPLGPLSRFQLEEIVDPRDTRRLVCEWVENAYRMVAQQAQQGPRPLQFRP
ncbi:MAG: carboxyl transferase domain-containing protein [Dehalococcoidia bacterium]|nr:ATP-grasp domain-containing protein [Dehalococcoidia bacterium]MCB9484596.1 ATP-grasp domain-containing protein [Thermoflexaceae bacterium]